MFICENLWIKKRLEIPADKLEGFLGEGDGVVAFGDFDVDGGVGVDGEVHAVAVFGF